MWTKTLILLIISSFVYAADDCDVASCAKPLKHHEELGCKANYDDGKCCPSYDCSDYTKLDPSKCHFNGEAYEVGQALARNVSGLTCTQSCFCSRSEEQPAKFICAQQSCGFFQSQSCVNVYGSLDECCSTASICDDDQKSALSTCYLNDKLYYEGQKMYPESDPCYVCLCQKNFDNSTFADNKHCQKVNCGIELHSMSYIQKGCIPIYLEKKACCPISWKCPEEETTPASTAVPATKSNENVFVVTPAVAAVSEEQETAKSVSESVTTTEKISADEVSSESTTTAASDNTEVPVKSVETSTVAKETVQVKELPAVTKAIKEEKETPEVISPTTATVKENVELKELPAVTEAAKEEKEAPTTTVKENVELKELPAVTEATKVEKEAPTTTVEPKEEATTSSTTTEKPKAIVIEAVPETSTEADLETTTTVTAEELKSEIESSTKEILNEITTLLAEAVEEVTTLKEEAEITTESSTTTESSSDIQTSFEGHTEHVSISVSVQTSESATKEQRKKRSSIYQLPTILQRVVRQLSTKNQCNFGSKTYNIGEQIVDDDDCLSCSCEIPPLAHCIRKLNCN
jgi:hypothetical protein